jgi:mycothiol synthase
MGLHVRAATLDDARVIDDLLNAWAQIHQGRSLDPGAAHDRLSQPDSEAVLVEDQTGAVVGFGHAWPAGSVVRCFARVHPGATGQGVGTALLTHLEQRAGRLGLGVFNVMQTATDTAAPQLLRPRGYVETCYVLQMQLGLGDYAPPNAPVPAGVDIVGFDRDRDSAQLFAAFQAAFPDDPDGEAQWWRVRAEPNMRFDPALWFVARQADDIAGFCLGSRREWKGSADGYISDVGVPPAHRGKGIALALLTTALTKFAADGLPTATLNVDTDNLSGAIRLYRKAGMHPTPLMTEWSKTLLADHAS